MANPKMATLVDPLHATTQDTTKWDPAANTGSPNFTTGGVVLPCPPGSTVGSGFQSLGKYDLTGSQTMLRVVDAGDFNRSYWRVTFGLCNQGLASGTWWVGWLLTSGYLFAGFQNSASSGMTTVSNRIYDPAVHKYLRLRESGGSVYWDFSTDGASWTNMGSYASGGFVVDVTQAQAFVTARNTIADTVNLSATVDSYGGVPASAISIDVSPAQATGSAPAPTFTSAPNATQANVPAAGATASAPAPSITSTKAIDVAPASASASAPAPTLRIASGAPQANGTGDAPPPMVGTLGRIDVDVGAAQGSATSAVPAISASVSAGTASGSSEAWGWSQALRTQPTAAFSTGQAPAPTVSLAHGLDVGAAGARGDAWPMAITSDHVNVAGPPIPAGRLVSTRSGHVARGSPGHVGTGPRQGVRA